MSSEIKIWKKKDLQTAQGQNMDILSYMDRGEGEVISKCQTISYAKGGKIRKNYYVFKLCLYILCTGINEGST